MLKFLTGPATWPMKTMLIISLEYTSLSHKSYCALFSVCSNQHTTFTLQRTRNQNVQFAFYSSDTHATLKQSQGQQTYNDNADPRQGYNHAKFQRPCFNGVLDKANVKVFTNKDIYVVYLPWTCAKMKNSGIFMIYLK